MTDNNTLRDQRAALQDEADYSYDPSAFPGSARYNKHRAAERALDAFDAQHPEIRAEIVAAERRDHAAKMASLTVDQIWG